jgi:hypothetical protein
MSASCVTGQVLVQIVNIQDRNRDSYYTTGGDCVKWRAWGEWRIENGGWRMENREWRIENGE